MQVSSPAGNVVHSVKGTSGDKFEFRAPSSGMYKFCFHNPHSTPETVSFYIHIGHIPNEHDLAKDGLSDSYLIVSVTPVVMSCVFVYFSQGLVIDCCTNSNTPWL